ncbi:Solute carrier organic anion transporter family, member 6d1 [Apodemus speciosus]|uniref:Solute carrier organic anion transporter family, member 6d1 n=1 Tax=Apodemus speciosus TaxID=105296 RepID=A0ABQ0EEB6_APOSI
MHNSTVKAPVDITPEAPVEERRGSDQEVIRVADYQTQLSAAMLDIASLQNPVSEDSSQLSDIMQDASLEGPFGVGPLVFPSLQRFNNINFFLVSFCILALAQGEQIKVVAAAAFLVGLGSIIFAVPYLKYEIVRPVEDTEAGSFVALAALIDLCILESTPWLRLASAQRTSYASLTPTGIKDQELCIDEDQKPMANCEEKIVPFKSEIISLSIIGQFLQGIAGMPLYILGVTYIYDNISMYMAGIYLGIADAAQILGYGLGYVVGSPNLRPSFNRSSEEVLPGAHKLKQRKEKEPLSFYKKLKNMKYGYHLQDLFHALWVSVEEPTTDVLLDVQSYGILGFYWSFRIFAQIFRKSVFVITLTCHSAHRPV